MNYDFYYDNQITPNKKFDAKKIYKKNTGYFPGITAIYGKIIYVENRDSNANVKFKLVDTCNGFMVCYQKKTLKLIFLLLWMWVLIQKILLICSKANLEDVYAALVMANGAVMEGIETKLFFTFFGLDAITKKRMNKLHTATVGNPGMRMPGGLPFPTWLGGIPGVEAGVTSMMKKRMEELDIPPVDEFLELIDAGGGEIYACKLAADMFKLKKEDFHETVKDIITVGHLYAMCDGEGTQIVFT